MSDYRRYYIPGGRYFFTVVTEKRMPIFVNDTARDCLRTVFRYCLQTHPFQINAMVMLPDHIHAIWTLPIDDYDYSKRWGIIKKHFTQAWLVSGGYENPTSDSKRKNRRRGIWQKRFWEHTLRNQEDYDRHFDYIHYNPIKHGIVKNLLDYPYSTFHRWLRQGIYPENWGMKYDPYFEFITLKNLE